VKTIRPADMQPYDYSKENYSRLGYVCEGVTTYMGDLFLAEAGVYVILSGIKKSLKNYCKNTLTILDASIIQLQNQALIPG
jgi:predicted metalloprotease with PDZ domain